MLAYVLETPDWSWFGWSIAALIVVVMFVIIFVINYYDQPKR